MFLVSRVPRERNDLFFIHSSKRPEALMYVSSTETAVGWSLVLNPFPSFRGGRLAFLFALLPNLFDNNTPQLSVYVEPPIFFHSPFLRPQCAQVTPQ